MDLLKQYGQREMGPEELDRNLLILKNRPPGGEGNPQVIAVLKELAQTGTTLNHHHFTDVPLGKVERPFELFRDGKPAALKVRSGLKGFVSSNDIGEQLYDVLSQRQLISRVAAEAKKNDRDEGYVLLSEAINELGRMYLRAIERKDS